MASRIEVLKEEHKKIQKELDKFEQEIGSTSNETGLLKTINEFVKNNSNYIIKHLTTEEILYDYLDKELGNRADLKELTRTKDIITKELSRLKNIDEKTGLLKIRLLTKDFIKGVKERISFEEDTLFEIADNIKSL